MKSGPTSAVTSARMSAIARPSRVVCTPSPPQVRPKSFAPGGVRRPRKKPGHQRVEHDVCGRMITAAGRARDPATQRAVISGALTANLCPRPIAYGEIRARRTASPALKLPDRSSARAADPSGTIRADSYRHDFPRVHDVVRIERALDGGHGRQRGASQLAGEVFHLALPDAVLAGARAVHGECALNQPLA